MLKTIMLEFNFDLFSDKIESLSDRAQYEKVIYIIYADNDKEFNTLFTEYEKHKEKLSGNKIIISHLRSFKSNDQVLDNELAKWKLKFNSDYSLVINNNNEKDKEKAYKDLLNIISLLYKGSPKSELKISYHNYLKTG